jgi:membrane fusion protein, multidrug efflux system
MPATLNEHPSRPSYARPQSERTPVAPPSLPGRADSPHRPSGPAPARPRRGRRFFAYVGVIGGALALIVALGFTKFSQISMLIHFGAAMQKAGPPPETVSTRPAEEQTWENTLNAVASVVSAKGVALANDSAGVVSALHFDSGQTVKQGQVLVELDSRVERAQLASTRAKRELAQTTTKRSQTLLSTGAIAQAAADADTASLQSLIADQSALEAQIDRKIIRAPFSGRLGLRLVNLGQYLAPGTTVATLESADGDYVDFTLPQEDLPLLHTGMVVRAAEDGAMSAPVEGTISAVDPNIDPATRSVKVRARFPGEEKRFQPGMFLRASVVLPEQRKVVAIPLMAVVHASYGDSVFVTAQKPDPEGKPRTVAEQKFVKTGDSRGDFVAVTDGLSAGEEVVTAGAFKLRNGLPLKIDNTSVKLDPKLAPKPVNH